MSMKRFTSLLGKRRRSSPHLLLPLLLVIALVLSLISLPLSGFLDRHLSGLKTSSSFEDDLTATRVLSAQTTAEGAVLLENNESVLPLDISDAPEVCLFGLAAVQPVYADGRTSERTTLADSLTAAGFSVNEDLISFYQSLSDATSEPDASTYDAQLLGSVRNAADTAIVALSHTQGDAPTLSNEELSLLQLVANLEFERVIVLLNSPSVMQLDFVQDEAYGIDAALWIGAPGEGGMEAVGQLLSGEITPSGKTAATFAYDVSSAPSANGTLAVQDQLVYATNGNAVEYPDSASVSYSEGIYVGYRYYETRYAEDEAGYTAAVQYPFGYGLSYTTFDEEITGFSCDGTTVTMEVTVTNAEEAAGADVVEIYATLPYKKGGLEKASEVLVGYGRTETLNPGDSTTVEISFPLSDMASYDTKNNCFALGKGTYQIQLKRDAHTTVEARALNLTDKFKYDTSMADLSGAAPEAMLSRSNWTRSYVEAESAVAAASPAAAAAEEETTTSKVKKLSQLTGADYDDPMWDSLLNALSEKQLTALTQLEGDTIPAVKSIGLDKALLLDGSSGLIRKAHGVQYSGTLLPCKLLVGSTWDADLAEQLGAAEGQEAADMGLAGIYSPSGALMRNAWYSDAYSEDSLLTGSLLSSYASGVESTGTLCFVSGFGITEESGAAVQTGVQAMRELYLRPYALCLSSGSASGVIPVETAETAALLTDLLRGEWGFDGAVFAASARTDAADAFNAGASAVMTDAEADVNAETLKEAAHHTLYALANSSAVEGTKYGPKSHWRLILLLVDLVLLALNAATLYHPGKRSKKQ